MSHYGMVVNLGLCMSCQACMVACKTEHKISVNTHGSREYYRIGVLAYEEGEYPQVKRISAPILCMHCQRAPCIDVCPAPGAMYRGEGGIVALDKDKCNGCRRCIQVCPYDALYFDEENHTVDKCDFCIDRVAQGLEPSCVATCNGRALSFGDLEDPESDVAKLIGQMGAKADRPLFPKYFSDFFGPSVYYLCSG